MVSSLDPSTLLGRWRLTRTIDDRAAGQRSMVRGTLVLEAVGPDRVRWREDGVWARAGAEIPVRRTLCLVREPLGWDVLFEDGRLFHPWRPGEQVVHPCGADVYRGQVDGSAERWTVQWEVAGPGKDYTMLSEMSR